jgi:hypothetical protein
MKGLIICAAVATGALLGFGDPDPEKLLMEYLNSVEEITTVLKTVSDSKSAELALTKLEGPTQRANAAMEEFKKRVADPNKIKLFEKHETRLKEVMVAHILEVERLRNQPPLHKILVKNEIFSSLDNALQDNTRKLEAAVAIMQIEAALKSYKAKNGAWPATLKQLTQPDANVKGPPLIAEEQLTDPWGQPYQYEPNILDPATLTPLIYSQCGSPNDVKRRITNWNKK